MALGRWVEIGGGARVWSDDDVEWYSDVRNCVCRTTFSDGLDGGGQKKSTSSRRRERERQGENSLLERDAQFKPQYIHVSHETSPNKYSLYVGGGTIVPTASFFSLLYSTVVLLCDVRLSDM